MNEDNRADARRLRQLDDLLEHGTPTDDPLMNALAATVPQADSAFRHNLEERLAAHFTAQSNETKEPEMLIPNARAPQRAGSATFLTWAAAVLVVALLGGALLALDQRGRQDLPAFATQIVADEPQQTIVIATQNILPADTITEDMVGLISLSAADFAKLQAGRPDRQFFSSLEQVVGQRATTAMLWFEPVEPVKLGQVPPRCADNTSRCVTEPEGTYTIELPQPVISPEALGLVAGDHVDVMASADNHLTVIAADVLLVELGDGRVVLAAPSWKHTILVWLYRTEEPYTLRPTQANPPLPVDDMPVEYTFISPEPLPDDYQFDLIVEVEESQGYRLMDSPYTLDETQYTQRDTLMNFWYTDIEMVSISDETTVTIRVRQSDAANIDFLLGLGAGLTFNPDAAANP